MSTLEKIKTAALARLEAGEPPQLILQDYADYEQDLRPILEARTGQSLASAAPDTVQYKPKTKPHSQSAKSNKGILAGLSLLIIGGLAFGIASLKANQVQVTPAPALVTHTCRGIPQAAITSQYALNNMNQQILNQREEDEETKEAYVSEMGTTATTSGDVPLSGVPVDPDSPVPYEPPVTDGVALDVDESVADSSDDSAYDVSAEGDMDVRGERGEELTTTVAGYEAPEDRITRDPLRAGEIDDNADWDSYQDYRQTFLTDMGDEDVRDVDTTDRQVIRVVDSTGKPLQGACVEIYNGESFITSALTYATGMTLFFPNLNESTRYIDSFRVLVTYDGQQREATMDREAVGGVTDVQLDLVQSITTIPLDVVFLLDATGSMADEIAQLQGNILTISEQIDALSDDIVVRYGLVTYRDRGDEYVTRVHDFTSDVGEFQELLTMVRAGGGGDTPESLNEGLDMALNALSWGNANHLKLVFLVADAPPHVDYANDADYSLLMQAALARGIKIHQIASGGLTPAGEYVMRQIAQHTMGHFLFLTYDNGESGVAGDERTDLTVGDPEDEQGIGDYEVDQLDELVLRLIQDEIAALRGDN